MTHDYKRNGTTTLFAALDMLEGRLIGQCMPRHRHQEFIKFLRQIDAETPADLDLHLIVDNYATHKHPKVKAWLKRHKRFHLHFIPTSSSWLNLVERWFREITDKRIRRGSFGSVPELITATTTIWTSTIRTRASSRGPRPRSAFWPKSPNVKKRCGHVGDSKTKPLKRTACVDSRDERGGRRWRDAISLGTGGHSDSGPIGCFPPLARRIESRWTMSFI